MTTDPFIVYTSNIAAILSLRSLFAFVSDVMTKLHYLEKSVALVLGFIGFKLVRCSLTKWMHDARLFLLMRSILVKILFNFLLNLSRLGFVQVVEFFGAEVDTGLSLAVVCALLGGGVGASLAFPKEEEEKA